MASSLASTSPATVAVTKAATNLRLSHSSNSPKPNTLRFFTNSKGCSPGNLVLCTRVKAQLHEVALDGSSNAAPPIKAKSDEEPPAKPSTEPSSSVLATQESVSQFIAQVANLVKLVDSRDIVELKLKQLDCEVTIRKKEAMPQLQSPLQPVTAYSPPSLAMPPVAPASMPTPTSARPAPTPSTSPPAVKSAKSSHAPLKSPMAGTFYRSPAPGEPPFVKAGDKVKKGQVVCIIEAMKLMNEIEADQSGTIVEILAEDGKSVSVDTPLFVIEP
ncbi:biotin carboxyl carrier protein of acetyl-CoA carboxylase, chloroplastic-like isoform X2 [Abrus precatorius]|uniref:Biotin carboxyl carrier protein of acetyl-CoA carboxylase n=1 Tax=Abrus precatorius TaxID=3816 RepID=A0A8B8KYD5_ABRPR|nr:biotin carboxyl carrier protein of acetyl-CoA carboxylase, chloroplastic-like isoform X2 [Abrus precatorius]